ncbi:MAG: BMP family ABC transporter substrate-binding protein [Candidatus Bipolaricaulota bacterium]|nr:BMP family ABC transporter substrate-binding protein [Candidatus Bipolaricaulota bacterium]MCX7843876.1 BMP family ABC transporter substrate-binding protein [Candidatus Bipolaricaulota bacterium]MDW8151458.1 BMP family ABC transporter substrate-binding protein [Candidatus Bipolaricaulota bacterium]
MKRIWAVVLAVVALGAVALGATRIKAGFIYVGPIGDYGWTHAHDVGRRIVDEKYDWLETVYVESVPEGEVETYIDLLIRQGCNVIFTTSFGFMDGTLAAAQRYPNVIFAHCSGFKRWANMATYMADFYQVYYLNGLMAGALTKTGKIGYVAAFPIPEVKRHISAFAIGAREVNPRAEVHVRWIYEWYNPAAAKEATEALIAEGCDVFAFTEDSPTVVQVAAEKGLPSFGHYSPMYDFAPDHVVSGQLVHWEKIYEDFLVKVHKGIYTTKNLAHVDYWWLLAQGAVEVGAKPGMVINPKYEAFLKNYVINHPVFGRISVYDLVFIRLNQMADPGITFDPFQGPIYDRKGRLVVPAGMWMSYDALITMEWAAAGIVGPWPGEP